MKIFVWRGDGVLEDYTSGLIVVVAPTIQDALKTIERKYEHIMHSFPHDEYEVFDTNTPHVWYQYGSA